MSGYAVGRGDGWVYRHGVDFAVKAGELGTGNGAAVMEYLTAKGEEPPDHTHPTEDEMFYLVEGEVTFRCGDRSFDVGPGWSQPPGPTPSATFRPSWPRQGRHSPRSFNRPSPLRHTNPRP